MDSRTHVQLARHLVESLGASPSLAIASLFPQIDREPPTLHRLHAHVVVKARAITELGLAVFWGGETTPGYELTRFLAERDRMASYIAPGGTAELEPALVAFVSHLWLDTFNQPVQAFSPHAPWCSGQWELWGLLGDFRQELYCTAAIDRLRAELFADPIWAELRGFSASALLEAMLRRLTALSRGDLPESLVAGGMREMNIARDPRASVAASLLNDIAGVIRGLHERHLVARAPGAAAPARVVASGSR